MRKFWVAYRNEINPINTTIVVLQENEKANTNTFYLKIKQKCERAFLHYDHWTERNIISWSLIEE